MSNWTHVAAIFRVDSLSHEGEDFTKIFGKELDYYDSTEKWNEASDRPEHFLPLGSEGSLQMSVWENPNKNCMDAFTISVFGDLRDHDSIEEIIKWFDEKCSMLWIRQAVITVENEWFGTQTKTYGDEG